MPGSPLGSCHRCAADATCMTACCERPVCSLRGGFHYDNALHTDFRICCFRGCAPLEVQEPEPEPASSEPVFYLDEASKRVWGMVGGDVHTAFWTDIYIV